MGKTKFPVMMVLPEKNNCHTNPKNVLGVVVRIAHG